MEKVIILKGAGGRGKTPTLNLLIERLLNDGASIAYNENYTLEVESDCFVILDVIDFGKVGVITYGDKGCEEDVINAIHICQRQNCIALVAASHMQYNKDPKTIYKILWDFGCNLNAKIVETTTIIKYDNWGRPMDEKHINSICAENLLNILLKL